MTLTALRPLVSNPHILSVVVDKEYIGNVSIDDASELGLIAGQDLSQETLAELKLRIQQLKYYRDAQRYADRRLRSTKEVLNYLTHKGCDAALASKIVERLGDIGLINNAAFTSAYIHDSLLAKPLSKRGIMQKLKTKGIDSQSVAASLAVSGFDEDQALDAMIERKSRLSQYANNQPKLFRYLLTQGFSYGAIADRIGHPQSSGRHRGGNLAA